AAAEGAARLTGTAAVVFVTGPDGSLHRGTSRERGTLGLPDPAGHEAVARLLAGLVNGHSGVRSVVVPAALWPAGFFHPNRREAARLVLAVTRGRRTPVCVATPAPAPSLTLPSAHHDGLLSRLAQVTALAAEPLLLYQAERHVALTLQHSFLPRPDRPPRLSGVELVVRYVPASPETEIGGDFYAAVSTRGGVLTAVGDVVGHSLEAATVMVEIRHALRAYCVEDPDPAALAARLDRMVQHYHPEVTATVCLALLDPATGRLRVANAGHLPPLIVKGDHRAEYVDVAGPLLGLGLERPQPTELVLDPADRLLMVTDGLIETRGTDLGVSLAHLRTAAAGAPPGLDALCDLLLGRFGHSREDDIAMLALRLG
ncbi:PP2C family protein-serine/threonine phosphatase, partial [Streptomyces sp. NPDC002920]